MAYRSGRPTGYKCHACDADTRWSEKYCSRCEQIPERRCLDCGATTRAGTLDYVPAETVAPSWTEYRENIGYEIPFTPKPVKVREVKGHDVVVPGPCRACGSANLARLEFGLDQLPVAQRECPAWSDKRPFAGSGTLSSTVLNKSMDDRGITWKTCASCGERLYARFKAGASEKWKLSEDGYWRAARSPRLDLPDGKWMDAGDEFLVHQECPDPPLVALPYEVERPWDHVKETRYRAVRPVQVAA